MPAATLLLLEASGRVKFDGNDRKNLQMVQQVINGITVEVCVCFLLVSSIMVSFLFPWVN